MSAKDALKELGLNDKETKIYLTLLEKGRMMPSSLARITKINRATVYSAAKSLQSKGMVHEDFSGKSRYLLAASPTSLEQILIEQKRELDAKAQVVKDTIQELLLITTDKQYSVPKLQFIQESDLERFLFANTVKWQESALASDKVWWGFQDHTFVEIYESWIHATWTTPQGKDAKFRSNMLSNRSTIENKLREKYSKPKRNMRFMADTNFTSTVWVAGEYLVMVMTQHHPFYLFEIRDETLAHNMREVLKKLWESTEE